MSKLHTRVFDHHAPGNRRRGTRKGFALVVTLSLMILLTVIAVGLLTLSSIALRSSSTEGNIAIAKANARLALMLALGDLQQGMGPDTRVSASSAILDSNASTPEVDGVKHPHLLGVWQSWGGWLNAQAQDPGGNSLAIAATYDVGRTKMFRKWLVSLAPTQAESLDFAKTGVLDSSNSVELVSTGSVRNPVDHVRAGLLTLNGPTKQSGHFAWWVAGENEKADITQNAPHPSLSPGDTELAHGNGTSKDMSKITGLTAVKRDKETVSKLVTTGQLAIAGADRSAIVEGLHDFTANSIGLMTDVRWGGLRKDLSLLFDQPTLPANLTRSATTAYSPRPLSEDLLANYPKIPERGFTSFEQMQAFARQFKNAVNWKLTVPVPKTQAFGNNLSPTEPEGFYRRMPVISKFYSIYNLQTVKNGQTADVLPKDKYDCYLTYSPVVQLWNPYSVPIEISQFLQIHTLPYKIMPVRFKTYKNNAAVVQAPFTSRLSWVGIDQEGQGSGASVGADNKSPFQKADGSTNVIIGPGEFMLFSFKSRLDKLSNQEPLRPGFDPAAVGSARVKVLSGVTQTDNPQLALQIQPYWGGANAQWWGGNPGGLSVIAQTSGGSLTSTGLNLDWFAGSKPDSYVSLGLEKDRQDFASISPDENVSSRAKWSFADSEPVPIAVMGAMLKTSENLTGKYDTISWASDWRNKTWSQAMPGTDAEQMLASYADPKLLELQRMNGAYQVYFRTINGSAELSDLVGYNPNGVNGFLGSTLEAPISAVVACEIPTAPVQSLAGFSGLRLQPGWYDWQKRQNTGGGGTKDVTSEWPNKIAAYKSGVPGLGVGNSFAVPMILGDKVYQNHDLSKSNPNSHIAPISGSATPQDSNAFSDFWDHQLLVNDGLWDSWFTSSLASGPRPSDTAADTLPQLLDKVFKNGASLANQNFVPSVAAPGTAVIADLQKADGYLRSAVYLANRGAFNVNSTSADAWYSLFTGLREHSAVYRDASGELKMIPVAAGKAVVTRYNTETAATEVADPRNGVIVDGLPRWTGVRFLDDGQLRKLAEQCIGQVKKRGPFLNMSDFINRRLSTDDMGTRGALQAAIDYDDQTPDTTAINHRFKGNKDMIADAAAALYPFPDAAKGSLFAGAPGYVVQSDILKPLGNSLTVRDDSFRIRAYGESTDSTGKVLARAYCEAIVQRTVDYVDPANDPTVPAIPLDANGNPTGATPLTKVNERFGRHLQILSFRWLAPNEI